MPNKIITKKDEMYGVWKVLEPNVIDPNTTAKTYIGRAVFSKCLCTNCNQTIRYIRNNELKKHSSKLCKKCMLQERMNKSRPQINQVFGKLTIIQDGGADGLRHYSICKCECGNIVKIQDNRLKSGNTSSCGKCKYSKGEYQIKSLLDNNNLIYDYDCVFPELLAQTQRRLRFDFIIYNIDGTINRFIEFDGNQHKTGMWGGNWSNIETYETIHERDEIKNNFCIKNNYILVRIPYYKLQTLTLEDLMGEEYIINE